jgi:hypothetical protein
MSVFGLFSTFLMSSGLINPENHYVNLSELTNNSFVRDLHMEDSYVFPYFLGLILTGDGLFDIAGHQFYRISGWAHEPTSASLFVAPAIILLLHSDIVKGWKRIIALFIVILFWMAVFSVGSILAFLVLYSSIITSYVFIKLFPAKVSISLLLLLITFVLGFLYFYEGILSSSILTSKFDMSSNTVWVAVRELTWFVPNIEKTTGFYAGHLFNWVILLIFLITSLYALIYTKYINVYSVITLYLVIHTMKGSQDSVFLLPFAFFWFYMVVFSIYADSHSQSCLTRQELQ